MIEAGIRKIAQRETIIKFGNSCSLEREKFGSGENGSRRFRHSVLGMDSSRFKILRIFGRKKHVPENFASFLRFFPTFGLENSKKFIAERY